MAVWLVEMEADAAWQLPKSAKRLHRAIYLYAGSGLQIEGQLIPDYHSVQLVSDAEISIKAVACNLKFLMLQAKPINEPVVQHGPFVMNTQAEIMQAFEEYRETEFGGWPWPQTELVHPREKQRFAQYPDGSVEEKGA